MEKLKKDTIKGIISHENQTLEYNRISNDLLNLLTSVEDHISVKGRLAKSVTSNQSGLSSKAHEFDDKVKYATALEIERCCTFFKHYYANRKNIKFSKGPSKIEEGRLNIYSMESDQLLTGLEPGQKINNASWSPIDGSLLASCAGSETQIWQLR